MTYFVQISRAFMVREMIRERRPPLYADYPSHVPMAEIRVWAWSNGYRYVLRRLVARREFHEIIFEIGFESQDAAFEFKMRWG